MFFLNANISISLTDTYSNIRLRLSLCEFLIVFLVSIYPGSNTKNSPMMLLHQADSQLSSGFDFPLL